MGGGSVGDGDGGECDAGVEAGEGGEKVGKEVEEVRANA